MASTGSGSDDYPPEFVDRILETSECNPLFLRELVRMLVDDGVLRREGDHFVVTIDMSDVTQLFDAAHQINQPVTWTGPVAGAGRLFVFAFPGIATTGLHDGYLHDYRGSPQELVSAVKRGFLYHFSPHARLALAPLGFVLADFRPGCLFLSTFHTFPGEHTVVKTQSLIERRA